MGLAHRKFEMRLPPLVMKAELGVAINVLRMRGAILFPEQLACHSLMLQLFMDGTKSGGARRARALSLVFEPKRFAKAASFSSSDWGQLRPAREFVKSARTLERQPRA